MGVKRRAVIAQDEESSMNWREQCRRPFKRGFLPYGPGSEGAAAASKRRKSLGISVVEDPAGKGQTPVPIESFEELGTLPPWVIEALHDQGRYEPTPLQAQALPVLVAGQNLVGMARTGQNQAAEYLIPAILHIEDQPALTAEEPGPVVIVLTRTQQLADRVSEEANNLLIHSGRSKNHPEGMRAVDVSGSGSRKEKLEEIGELGAHILVGTPKRLHDMAQKEQVSLQRVTYLVLDGADKILELGFQNEVRELSSWIRPERQTLLFTATWPKPLHEFASELFYASGLPVRFSAPTTTPKVVDDVTANAGEEKSARKKAPKKIVAEEAEDAEEAAGDLAEGDVEAGEVDQVDGEATGSAAAETWEEGNEEFPDEWA